MTNKELNINHVLHTIHGDEVRVVERTSEFYLIRRLYLDDFGEIGEGQEEIYRGTLYEEPPQESYHKDIKKLKDEIKELEFDRLNKSAELRKEKKELEDNINELQKAKEAYPCFEQVSLILQILHNKLSTKCYMFVKSTLEILEVESTNDILKKLKGSTYYGLKVQLKANLDTKLDKTKEVEFLIQYYDEDSRSWDTTNIVVGKNLDSLNLYVANLLSEWLEIHINRDRYFLKNKELVLSKLDCFNIDEKLKSEFKTVLYRERIKNIQTDLNYQRERRDKAIKKCTDLERDLNDFESKHLRSNKGGK